MEDKICFARKDVEASPWTDHIVKVLDQYFGGLLSEQEACACILDAVYPAYLALDKKGVDREMGWVCDAIVETRLDLPFDEPAKVSWREHLRNFDARLTASMAKAQ